MEEKDRLGDKLHDKGRAEEDLYIAQQERERLAKRQAAARAAGTGACPRDGEPLVRALHHQMAIHACPACKGVWLDNGELEAILAKDHEPAVTRWLRTVLGR